MIFFATAAFYRKCGAVPLHENETPSDALLAISLNPSSSSITHLGTSSKKTLRDRSSAKFRSNVLTTENALIRLQELIHHPCPKPAYYPHVAWIHYLCQPSPSCRPAKSSALDFQISFLWQGWVVAENLHVNCLVQASPPAFIIESDLQQDSRYKNFLTFIYQCYPCQNPLNTQVHVTTISPSRWIRKSPIVFHLNIQYTVKCCAMYSCPMLLVYYNFLGTMACNVTQPKLRLAYWYLLIKVLRTNSRYLCFTIFTPIRAYMIPTASGTETLTFNCYWYVWNC